MCSTPCLIPLKTQSTIPNIFSPTCFFCLVLKIEKYSLCIHAPQRMNPTDFSGSYFLLFPPWNFSLIQPKYQHLLDGFAPNFVQMFKVPRQRILMTLVILRLFLLCHHEIDCLFFSKMAWKLLHAVQFGTDINVPIKMKCNLTWLDLSSGPALIYSQIPSKLMTFPWASAVPDVFS